MDYVFYVCVFFMRLKYWFFSELILFWMRLLRCLVKSVWCLMMIILFIICFSLVS